jgi:hypothetical protein
MVSPPVGQYQCDLASSEATAQGRALMYLVISDVPKLLSFIQNPFLRVLNSLSLQ